ncbi:MAG: hypothetical protein R3296_03240 [Oleiphilaceae bacterium]|nr:hypothetical protein [Oleiphilaceae bacterium]
MFFHHVRPLLLCAPLLLATAFPSLASTMPETFVPKDPEQTLLKVNPRDDAAWQSLREDRQTLLEQPDDLSLALDLARRAIEQGRRQDDPRFFGYAEGALSHWWDMNEPPLQVRVLRATIFQYRHRFDAAMRDLDTVIERDPNHAQARLTRAIIHTVQARYQAALEDCARLSRLGLRITALTCSATPASLTGSAGRAFELLSQIPQQGVDDNTLVWALTVRAEIAERLGRADTEDQYRQALKVASERPDRYLANAFADWLLDQGRPDEVLTLLADFADSDGSLLRLALAQKQRLDQGLEAASAPLEEHKSELRARFAAERERGGAVHHREAAMFQLHLENAPGEALWMARDNFRNQREPLDARILLESALAAEAPGQALPAVRWMRGHGVTDVRLEPLVARIEASAVTDPAMATDGDRP